MWRTPSKCRQKGPVLPDRSPLTACTPFQKPACSTRARRDTIVTGKRPSPLSCSPVAPGTTRSAANDPATALQRHRRTSVRSYLRHSPRLLRLEHLDDDPGTGDHPGGSSPSRVSDARRLNGHVAGSWAPGLASYVHPPGRHSFRGARQGVPRRFQRVETRSSRLPIDAWLERFGTVSVRTYRQALPVPSCRCGRWCLSWLSFSPSGHLHPIAEPCPRPGRPCRQERAPHAGTG